MVQKYLNYKIFKLFIHLFKLTLTGSWIAASAANSNHIYSNPTYSSLQSACIAIPIIAEIFSCFFYIIFLLKFKKLTDLIPLVVVSINLYYKYYFELV